MAQEPARETTSEVAFLEQAPSFGAAQDAGKAGTCAQLTVIAAALAAGRN